MKTSLPFLLILLLFTIQLKAQSNFKKGFVVTLQGYTLKGFIDFREWNQSPKSFSYKATLDSKDIQDITPENSRFVSIENLETYRRYAGPISMDEVVLPKISTGIDTSTITKTIFLKVLQIGSRVSLFSYRDNIKTRFYLQYHDQQEPKELIYRNYYQVKEANERRNKPEFTVQSKLYIGQLWFAATKYQAGTPELKRQLDLIQYSEPDILKMVSKINGITKDKVIQPKVAGSGAKFFIGAGVNRTIVKNSGQNIMTEQYYWDEARSMEKRTYSNREEMVYAPKLNAGIDFAPFPKTQKFLLRGEFALTATHFVFSNIQTLRFPDRQILYEFKFKQVIASFAPQLIYNLYNASRFKFYLGLGAAYNYCFYPENTLNIKPLTPGTGDEVQGDNFMPFAKYWINFPYRAGVLINNKLDLSVISWTPITMAHGKSLMTKANSLHVGLNFIWN